MLIEQDFPDPEVIVTEDGYVAFATNSGRVNVQVATSPDGRDWCCQDEDALPALPTWAAEGATWAPGIHRWTDGRWHLYFAARHARLGVQCIGVATSEKITGPYVPVAGEPLVSQADRGGVIDPSVFVDSDGSAYLLWKNDGELIGGETWIQLQRLGRDGLSLVDDVSHLVTNDLPWEGTLVEAPALIRRGDLYWLFYSGSFFRSPEYATGAAWSTLVRGPYTKLRAPVLSTESTGLLGPGGASVVGAPDGDLLFFHAWDDEFVRRRMAAAQLTWVAGRPTATLAEGAY